MKRALSLTKSIFLILFLTFSSGFFSVARASEEEPKEAFKLSEVILDHVMDSHVWHLTESVVIPLPVILYSEDRGLEVFSSGNFFEHHHPIEYNGYKLEHNHIY